MRTVTLSIALSKPPALTRRLRTGQDHQVSPTQTGHFQTAEPPQNPARFKHRRAHYQEALKAHSDAYSAAAQTGDRWNMAQCIAWQAYGLQAIGRSRDSLTAIHTALRLIPETEDLHSTSLRGRLLTSAAMYAAHLRDTKQASSMWGYPDTTDNDTMRHERPGLTR